MTERLKEILGLERRIELDAGAVLVGGSVPATRLILAQLLQQTPPEKLTELAGAGWREAAFIAPPALPAQTVGIAGNFKHWPHYGLVQRLAFSLHQLLKDTELLLYTRDVFVKLGQDALTPDAFVAIDDAQTPMRDYYLEGPPRPIIEVTPGIDEQSQLRASN